MSLIEVLLIAVSLCFDTLAVSLAGGACIGNVKPFEKLKIVCSFAFFQGGFTLLGWLLGNSVTQYVDKYAPWLAFLLLLYIGGKMIWDSFQGDPDHGNVDLLSIGKLIISSIATSIDALAVGISFAMTQMGRLMIYESVIIIAGITAITAVIGLRGGKRLGELLGSKASLVGGIILVIIGLKILLF